MRITDLVRRIIYIVLGAGPATFLAIPLLLNWAHYVSTPQPQGAIVYVYFAVVPALSALGALSLWIATFASLPIAGKWTRVGVFIGLASGLGAVAPWCIAFLAGVTATLRAPLLGISAVVRELPLLWVVFGPVLVAMHVIVLSLSNASNNLYGVPRQARDGVDRRI